MAPVSSPCSHLLVGRNKGKKTKKKITKTCCCLFEAVLRSTDTCWLRTPDVGALMVAFKDIYKGGGREREGR